jgi:tetratricopeptide (TPR) repeat protein
LNLAELLLSRDDVSSAGRHLDQAIPLLGDKPEAAYARYLRAKVYIGLRDPARAAGELEKTLALAPDLAEAWSDLGEARRILGDDAGSLAAFRRAVSLDPDDAVAQTRLGAKLLDSGEAHEAVEHLEAGVRSDPRNQTALNALQRALRQDGQTERADAVKRKLAELLRDRDRDDEKLVAAMELNNRGAELESRGDVKGALEKYRAAARLQPEHVGIQVNLAVALLKLGNWNEGISQMRDALRRDPGNTQLEKALDDAIAQARKRGIVVPKQ